MPWYGTEGNWVLTLLCKLYFWFSMYRTIIIVSGILFFISRLNIAFLLIRKQLRYIEAELFVFFFTVPANALKHVTKLLNQGINPVMPNCNCPWHAYMQSCGWKLVYIWRDHRWQTCNKWSNKILKLHSCHNYHKGKWNTTNGIFFYMCENIYECIDDSFSACENALVS